MQGWQISIVFEPNDCPCDCLPRYGRRRRPEDSATRCPGDTPEPRTCKEKYTYCKNYAKSREKKSRTIFFRKHHVSSWSRGSRRTSDRDRGLWFFARPPRGRRRRSILRRGNTLSVYDHPRNTHAAIRYPSPTLLLFKID